MTDRYKAALETILNKDYPRQIMSHYREDQQPTKYDLCPHKHMVSNHCEICLNAYIESVLAGDGET